MDAKISIPISFHGKTYDKMSLLLNDMALNWNDGIRFLLSGEVQKRFRKIDSKIASSATTAMTSCRDNPMEKDHIFWKWIYRHGGIRNLYWKGRNYGDWNRVAYLLRKGTDSELNRFFVWMLKEQQVSVYAQSISKPDEVVQNIKFLERNYSKTNSGFRKSKAIPMLILLMDQNKTFSLDGKTFYTIDQFTRHLNGLTQGTREQFANAIKPLFLDEYNFTSEFEAWILNQKDGQVALASWISKYQEGFEATDSDDSLTEDTGLETADLTTQNNEEFARSAAEFETEFFDLLNKYPDAILNSQKFSSLMNDLFPQKHLQANLIVILQKMDIVQSIKDATEMSQSFSHRFEKRLANDFGVKNSFAKWAVSIWCVCYGKKVLGKKGNIEIEDVMT